MVKWGYNNYKEDGVISLKQIIAFLIVLVLMSPLYIGIHSLVYSTEYNRIKVLKTEISKEKTDTSKVSQYEKDKEELVDLEKKVDIFKIIN